MDLISSLSVAISLGMDCFAVCVAAGTAVRESRGVVIGKMALLFGLFQGGMTILGWMAGTSVSSWIEPVDHWIAAGLLGFVGIRMIQEGLLDDDDAAINFSSTSVLLILAVATSIDAFAVGLSFSVLAEPVLVPSLAIGVASVLMSGAGFAVGDRFGGIIGSRAEICGGLVLMVIGARVLMEGLAA